MISYIIKEKTMTNIKTFKDYSMVTVDRTDVCLKGIRYIAKDFYCEIIEEDMPKMKELLGERLFKWALDGGKTIEIAEDEVWSK
tara:strand:- start:227 stop:478 length:252 start_codon:yes stop_codon:yes gene_type:complete